MAQVHQQALAIMSDWPVARRKSCVRWYLSWWIVALTVPLFASELPVAMQALLDRHCYECHDDDVQKGDINLAGM